MVKKGLQEWDVMVIFTESLLLSSWHPWHVGKRDKESLMFILPLGPCLSTFFFQQNMNLLNTVQFVAQVSLAKFCSALQEVVKYGLGLCVACGCPFPFPENHDSTQTVVVKNYLRVFVIHRMQWGLMWKLQLNDGNFYSDSNKRVNTAISMLVGLIRWQV